MATVTGLTADRMIAIEGASVVSGAVDAGTGHLILTTHDGTVIDAGYVWGTVVSSDTTHQGIVELATDAETTTGTDAARAVTPHGLAAVLVNFQPLDSDLTAIAALSAANDDVVQRKAGAWANRTIAQLATDLSASALQPKDADLTAIAGLSPSANDTLQFISGAWANRTVAQVKTTLAIAESDVASLVSDLAAKAPTASPTFSGTITAAAATFSGKITNNGALVSPSEALTVSSNLVATDASLGNYYRFTANANFTLSNPTNPSDGQTIEWEIIQDATGSRIMTLGSAFALGTDITAATLTTTANKRDFLTARYNSTASKWYIRGFSKGY